MGLLEDFKKLLPFYVIEFKQDNKTLIYELWINKQYSYLWVFNKYEIYNTFLKTVYTFNEILDHLYKFIEPLLIWKKSHLS